MGAFQPMLYQQEAVHRALRQIRPRLLLADAVGLGKTIEVGMILTELIRRGRADRILVLTTNAVLHEGSGDSKITHLAHFRRIET